MADSDAQPPSSASGGVHLVLYDGVCGLCKRLLRFLFVHDRHAIFDFASLQSPTGHAIVEQAGGSPDDLSSFYVVAHYKTPDVRTLAKSDAALFVAGELGWPWKALCALGMLPTNVLDGIYDFVARHRYGVFGRSDACLVPPADVRKRFIG